VSATTQLLVVVLCQTAHTVYTASLQRSITASRPAGAEAIRLVVHSFDTKHKTHTPITLQNYGTNGCAKVLKYSTYLQNKHKFQH